MLLVCIFKTFDTVARITGYAIVSIPNRELHLNKIKEDHQMKTKTTLASVTVLLFAGLLCSSLLAVFHGSIVSPLMGAHASMYPYFMAY